MSQNDKALFQSTCFSNKVGFSLGSFPHCMPHCEWRPLGLCRTQSTQPYLFLCLHRATPRNERKKEIRWNPSATPKLDLISLPFYHLSITLGFEEQE